MTRVLVDCRMSTWTGVGRYTTGLVRALAAVDGIELMQVVARGQAAPASEAPSRVADGHPFNPTGMRELGSIVREEQPDVTHCLHFPTPSPIHHPLVVTMHDVTPLVVKGAVPNRAKRLAYRWLNARAARHADAIICPSQNTSEDVGRFFAAARTKIHLIAEAADDFSSGPAEPLTAEVAAASEGRYILSMNSDRPHKDVPTLLKGFAQLPERFGDVRLLLVGGGDRDHIEGVLADSPAHVRARVVLTGRVTDGQLRTLYAGASAFAFPSLYEGFGLPPLEAMALGAPVVIADAASLPEVTGDAALKVPAGDSTALAGALERVLDDGELRAHLVEAGRARAAQFTWQRAAEQTSELYRRLHGAS